MVYLFVGTDEQKMKVELKSDADSAREDSLDEDDQKLVIKEEPDSINAEGNNLSQASSCDYNLSQFKDEPPFSEDERMGDEESQDQDYSGRFKQEPDESEEDMPLVRVEMGSVMVLSLMLVCSVGEEGHEEEENGIGR